YSSDTKYCRGMHQRWKNLVGQPHVGVYTIIEEFQKEQQKVEYQVEGIIRGAQCPAPKKEQLKENKDLILLLIIGKILHL
ncbi:2951_t:CDS:1, partial [Gigaspora rosea]